MRTASRSALLLALVFAVACGTEPTTPDIPVADLAPSFAVTPAEFGLSVTLVQWPGEAGEAFFINASGQTAGDAWGYPGEGFAWDEGTGFAFGPDLALPVSFPYALNDRGDVLQYATVPIAGWGEGLRPVVWNAAAGTSTVVSPPSRGDVLNAIGHRFMVGKALNNAGQVVGSDARSPGGPQAFLWDPVDGPRLLERLAVDQPSAAVAVNDFGVVAGWAQDAQGTPRAVVWSADGGVTDIGTVLGGAGSWAERINAAGQVQGRARNAAGQDDFFFWDPSAGATRIPVNGWWMVTDMNDRGQFVAMSENRSWLFDPSAGLSSIEPAPDYNRVMARALNNRGQVVGETVRTDSNKWEAALWDPDVGFVALDPGLEGVESLAKDINDSGTIVGAYWGYEADAMVLWSIPTPAEYAAALAAEVEALVALGSLDANDAAPLLTSLENALRLLEQGNTKAALNNLEAFINKVEALMGPARIVAGPTYAAGAAKTPNPKARRLSREDGEKLIVAARALMASLS